MQLRSYLAWLCGSFLLAPVLTACPADDDGTASDSQATTTTMSGTTMAGTTGEDGTTGTTGATTGEPTSSTSGGMSTGGGVAFADVAAIFSAVCNCHQTPPNPGNGMLQLTPETAHANIVGVKSSQATTTNLVEPGDPSSSYLWLKLDGGYLDVPGGGGDPMPVVGDLTPEQLATIEAWILAGAPAE